VLAKARREFDPGELTLSLLLGRSRMVGNALLPMFALDEDGQRTPDLGATRREAVYNHPDRTRNRLTQLSASWRQTLADGSTLEALIYGRHTRRETLNGDEAAADDPTAAANASINRTATRQQAMGASLAWSAHAGAHQWQLGASVDRATVHYEQTEQEAVFTADRGVQALDGPPEPSVRVTGRTESGGVYGTDTWQVVEGTFVTGTVRFNQSRVGNQLTTVDDVINELRAQPREAFTYRSLNPALGVSHRIDAGLTLFANVARNNRVPTVIELGCADPEAPCRLPAGLVSDPFLKQVISTTVEAGLRFGQRGPLRGSVALFRTINRDDILFRSVSVTGQLGYFENFPRTRHQGLDAQLETRLGDFEFDLGYSLLDATYQAAGTLRVGERNVVVRPGTRIAGLPRHSLKAGVDWRVAPGWTVGADLQAFSRRVTAGNEDGRISNDGSTRVDIPVPGYAVVNFKGSWRPESMAGVEFIARIANLFDRRYASFAALGQTGFSPDGSSYTGVDRDAWFAAPGAPRAFSVGARWTF
jgi:outer membrane receptor for Fe3+-dicitrate